MVESDNNGVVGALGSDGHRAVETDWRKVARLAKDRHDENWRFRSFLKMHARLDHLRVDAMAERFAREAAEVVDCRSCAACCRDNWIAVSDEEIDRLSRRQGAAVAAFREQYVCRNEFNEQAIDATPCPFLVGNDCSVYEDRPDCCREYPHIGGHVLVGMIGVIERSGTCPIIFHMLERLKDELHFRRYA